MVDGGPVVIFSFGSAINNLQSNLLSHSGSGLDFHRIRNPQRRGKGFETRVNPVALVLQFEEVAGERYFRPYTRLDLVRKSGQVIEARHRLLGGHEFRKGQIVLGAVGVLCAALRAGTLADRMQHTEADTVPQEVGLRL